MASRRLAQLKVVCGKRWVVRKRSMGQNLQLFLLPATGFLLAFFFYLSFALPDRRSTGYLELVFCPCAVIMLLNLSTVDLVAEKSARLLETMKIMSLKTEVYFGAYAAEGAATGFALSLGLAVLAAATRLFNGGAFASVFGLLWCFCLATSALACLIASVFDTAQTAGQLALGVQAASIAFFFVFVGPDVKRYDVAPSAQRAWCLLPHVAFELGVNSFRGPPTTGEHPRPAPEKRLAGGCGRHEHVLWSVGCPELEADYGIPNNDDFNVSSVFPDWDSLTYKRFHKYTQYDGIPLGEICGMLLLDALLFSLLAWYLVQVLPSAYAAPKPWYFPVAPLFKKRAGAEAPAIEFAEATSPAAVAVDVGDGDDVVAEKVARGDAPTVRLAGLRKCFGAHVAVRSLTFDMYDGEIFSLLGHNGAGKSTSINVLTGVLPSDAAADDGGATIYGHDIRRGMDEARAVTGVCPQHDVLFELLTAREHLAFFARLKGADADAAAAEADALLATFHLHERADHLGHELSGGMRRKLSTAVALCGGSKFALLDEPTAGMDALARRELWDQLAATKKGRTLLLTTHYMDEADVLGDRIGIMTHGALKCVGTSAFLKKHYGAGYRVVCERAPGGDAASLARFDALLASHLPGASRVPTLARRKVAEPTFEATLPFGSEKKFGAFFDALDAKLGALDVTTYGLTITSLEEVFLKVGADESVAPSRPSDAARIGAGRAHAPSVAVQIAGLAKKRLHTASHEPIKTLALLLLPIGAVLAGFLMAKYKVVSKQDYLNDLVASAIAAAGFLLAPALIAENIVSERETKLRNVLSVMGCDLRAYWAGAFLGDLALLSPVLAAYYVVVPATGMHRWLADGAIFWFVPMALCQVVAYSYVVSFLFGSAKRCVAAVPGLQIVQILGPQLTTLVVYTVIRQFDDGFSMEKIQASQYWLITVFSPQGTTFMALDLVATTEPAPGGPRIWEVQLIFAAEVVLYVGLCLFLEARGTRPLAVTFPDFPPASDADADVAAEAAAVADDPAPAKGGPHTLVVKRLRMVFPRTRTNARETVAVHDASFRVRRGECFGLLGANGAGKSTTMNMVVRHLAPTNGDVFVDGVSAMTDFSGAAEALGVVAQSNTLWDRLTCADHLKLFARIRGVPGGEAGRLTEAALDELELRPHATKLAMRLSGGMKRKLCVAIAIVGDPQCVLLDEPSAGLDPVSRRNLWNVVRATMDARAVVLTSHLMEEVEALCDRVAIMVKGRLRCLGTIQHLKRSLGTNYEVELRVDPEAFASDPAGASAKLRSLAGDVFGGAAVEDGAPNAGVFTFECPQAAMRMGPVFDALERRGEEAALVGYAISQPSLEAVFIRTVLETSGGERRLARALSTQSSVEDGVDEPGTPKLPPPRPRMTGCTRPVHWSLACLCFPAWLVLSVLSSAGGTDRDGGQKAFGMLSVVALVVAIWASIGCCCVLKRERNRDATCACCRP
ncbi:ABC transporter [Aureococcus anophagefferens]|uniref:ABC transporter n=1 Tax=Aureococcus anophagefferens TaxID=44056 RepID=A0ABR1FPQ7_AURAN